MFILSQISGVYRAVSKYFEKVSAAQALHGMTDHQLRDIGVNRDQIDQLVFEGPATAAESKPVARPGYKRPAFTMAATN